MSSPVQISDLPVATVANNNDLVILRQGLTDYQCAVSLIRDINIEALSVVPGGTPIQTDLMLVSRSVGGIPKNFQVQFAQVGFPANTRMWFWNSTPPTPNWSVVGTTGGNLLACQDTTTSYAASVAPGTTAGDWQQEGVNGGNPGGGLSIQQIPNHRHWGRWGSNQSNSHATFLYGARNLPNGGDPTYGGDPTNGPVLGVVNGQGDNGQHSNDGACLPHNHGSTWRPLANVGVIGNKDY